jgi:biopolymer transport protein ExbD
MRRFSQRNSLVTLSDINITPLLDLAFVLLIIFVITTPLLEKGLDLQLPSGGLSDSPKLDKHDIRTVEVSPQGYYRLDTHPMSFAQVVQRLVADHRSNPNLIVNIRADENGKYKFVADILNACEQNGIKNVSFRTDPRPRQ